MWKKYPEIGEGIFILKLVWMYCIEINAEKNVFKLVQGRSRRAPAYFDKLLELDFGYRHFLR